jgi:hypothetical protein
MAAAFGTACWTNGEGGRHVSLTSQGIPFTAMHLHA